MKLVDEILVDYQGAKRSVKLFIGDLAAIPASEAVDLLVVSAFPDDYTPTRTSLIGALHQRGISVANLAAHKDVDLRYFSSCWLSQEIKQAGIHFRRILCFEPMTRGRAPEVVSDIFRSLIPFTTGSPPISQIAMPIVASGDQGEPRSVMLESILKAAVHWLSIGLPIECIKIVDWNSALERVHWETFAKIKRELLLLRDTARGNPWHYDIFISYSHENDSDVDSLVGEMLKARRSLRVFLDKVELQPGNPWQQHLFEVLDQCRKVVTVFSPAYLSSKVCKEEFNIALFRHRESQGGVLFPVYLYSSELPTYMKLVQYEDVREGDREKIAVAAKKIISHLEEVAS